MILIPEKGSNKEGSSFSFVDFWLPVGEVDGFVGSPFGFPSNDKIFLKIIFIQFVVIYERNS